MKKTILILTLLTLSFNIVSSQTVFGFETATDTGATITETIDGITVTLSGDPDLEFRPGNDFGGTSGNVALTQNTITSVTFTFDQPVVVNSIIPIEANGSTVDYTFTPTGGSNQPVTASLVLGQAPTVNLNWVNVTSFTVTSSGAAFGFDDLSVDTGTNGQTFFEWETAVNNGGTITETVNGIGVTVSGDSSYSLTDYGGVSGTSGNVILSNATRTSITFTFDQPVAVNSVLALEGTGANIDYTFTPTGGNNTPVTKSLVSGVTAVKLNWINVTSFTVTSSGSAFGFDNLSVTGISNLILFDSDTNAVQHTTNEYGNFDWNIYVTETIDGVTVKVESAGFRKNDGLPHTLKIIGQDWANGFGTDNVLWRGDAVDSPVIVTFDQPVVVNSLLAHDWSNGDLDYTFTPTGGNNSAVTVSLVAGEIPIVNLNWIGVTSFTITPSIEASIMIDDLSVYAMQSLGTAGNHKIQNVSIYPNPVKHKLYIKNVSGLRSVTLYNLFGQEVLNSTEMVIDISTLSPGIYLCKIDTNNGIETKKIVKR